MTQTTAAPHAAQLGGPVAVATDLVKSYGTGDGAVTALRGVSAVFARGQFTAIMGPSGSGKSTFLHCLAGLDTVTSGSVRIGDVEITGLSRTRLTKLRRDRLGFVFQSFNLLPMLTAEENIRLTGRLGNRRADRRWFDTIVDALGLRGRLSHRPSELSGGQQQRVAVARALLTRPEVLFADEPTGNLDSRSGAEVLGFLRTAVDDYRQTVIMVTHDPGAAAHADRVLFLADGMIVHELAAPTIDGVHAVMRRMEG
ncbi:MULTISPECIES: ABC transporter ATP-binding protein [Actinomadura]|uniref:ATP-binding cassette domain-containing protein n=1 Tax=Actinomadura litoris TaxID=2678616 RepID=A0A7K1L5U6_9ACTN|nr:MULTISPECIES: ABC transporter ATP-binding protein [Actinomadura]MBT2208549.1 ABC transporter ATP-binding protein [Actinomadura sp. NEAU-AAG7]MUN39778.1 ATP-binding cassette domain-containing protein [Actinomadura litoris]